MIGLGFAMLTGFQSQGCFVKVCNDFAQSVIYVILMQRCVFTLRCVLSEEIEMLTIKKNMNRSFISRRFWRFSTFIGLVSQELLYCHNVAH